MDVRVAQESDAKSLIDLFEELDVQTPFMLYEPGERSTSLQDQEKTLAGFLASKHKMMAVYDTGTEIAGFIVAIAGTLKRNHKTAHMAVGVNKKHSGSGIGTALIQYIERWALTSGIHRIEFTVMEDNVPARSLYAKLGYEEEGVRRQSIVRDGQFVNEYFMSKLLEPERPVSSGETKLRE